MLNAKLTLVNGLFSLKSRDFFLKKKILIMLIKPKSFNTLFFVLVQMHNLSFGMDFLNWFRFVIQ